ncbi:MAG: hypothetical protein MHM6MM_005185 [Cercozoa sp. M6MM]
MFTDDNGGGGFLVDNGMEGAGGTVQEGERALRPVTVKQVLAAEGQDENLMLNGRRLEMVKLVGIISSEETSGSRSNYNILDTTGEIGVTRFWVENRDGEEQEEIDQETLELQNQCKQGAVVAVFGFVKQFNQTRTITANQMRPVEPNELAFHFLEVMDATRYLSQAKSANAGMGGLSGTMGGMQTTFGGSDPFANSANFGSSNVAGANGSNVTEIILNVLRERDDEDMGIERADLHLALQGKASSAEVDKALAMLMDEGDVFTVFDTEHFKITH